MRWQCWWEKEFGSTKRETFLLWRHRDVSCKVAVVQYLAQHLTMIFCFLKRNYRLVLIALDYQQAYYLAVNLNLLNFYFDTRSLRSLKRKEKVRNQATFAQRHPFFLYCLRDVYPLLNNELLKGTTVNILRNVFNVWILPFKPKYQNSTVPRGDFTRWRWEEPITTTK